MTWPGLPLDTTYTVFAYLLDEQGVRIPPPSGPEADYSVLGLARQIGELESAIDDTYTDTGYWLHPGEFNSITGGWWVEGTDLVGGSGADAGRYCEEQHSVRGRGVKRIAVATGVRSPHAQSR